ncbi:MAG: zinc-ribbon domain-containing protein [Candidatus Thorarchaeota archaeon]|jgi:predicted RNA-binding Zn-ribbon protein involved in translation (DUF1610 family)
MRCPWCNTEIESGVKSCPNCKRLIIIDAQDRLFSQSSEYTGVRHQQGKVLVDQDIKEDVQIETEGQDDTIYSDILEPRSHIDIRGVGTKLDGAYHVASVRHKITASDESDEKTRCPNCGRAYEKKDRFCRKCGAKIPS